MEDGSGLRRARRWRLLLAHDATAATCNLLIDSIEGALGNVDVSESSSIDDARVAVRGSIHDGAPLRDRARFHLAMVCLDLPPAPLGGVRLAQELLGRGLPVILVTRSLRWIPASATTLRDLPWIPPDASVAEVSHAVAEAMASIPALAGHVAQQLRSRVNDGGSGSGLSTMGEAPGTGGRVGGDPQTGRRVRESDFPARFAGGE